MKKIFSGGHTEYEKNLLLCGVTLLSSVFLCSAGAKADKIEIDPDTDKKPVVLPAPDKDKKPIENVKVGSDAKYFTAKYDNKKDTTDVTIPSDKFMQYLIDKGVDGKDIPAALKAKDVFNVISLKVYCQKDYGNVDLTFSKKGMALVGNSKMAYHLYTLLGEKVYGKEFKGNIEKVLSSIDEIIHSAKVKNGQVFYVRHWQYRGADDIIPE